MDLYVHDVFVPIDGAWRMMYGQRPHVDFYTPFGIGTYLPTLLGFALSKGSINGFGIGQSLVGMCLAVWALVLGKSRLSTIPLGLFCLLVTLTAVGVSGMGQPTFSFTPGMTYNRQCYALMMIMLLESLVASKKSEAKSWVAGVSTGAALALLLFTKISFFLVAAVMLTALLFCRPQSKSRLVGMIGGFATVSIAFAAYFHFDLRPMLQDIAIAAKAKHIQIRFYVFDDILQSAVTCALLGLGAWVMFRDRSLALGGLVIAIFGVGLLLTSYEPSGFPLLSVLAVIVLNRIGIELRSPKIYLALYAVVPLAVDLSCNSIGLVAASIRNTGSGSTCRAFDSTTMSGAVACGSDAGYIDNVDDGVALIKKYKREGDRVLSLDFANPFPFVLRLQPMEGGTNNQQFRTTFSANSFPKPDRLFGNSTLVAEPKFFTDSSLYGTVDQVYGQFLRSHFYQVGENRLWVLYRRNAVAY